jgi:ketosteroid isomerase-like protein
VLTPQPLIFLVAGHSPMRTAVHLNTDCTTLSQNRINSTGEIQEIVVSGDLAYCWSVLAVRVTPLAGGAATVRSGNALSILRKQSDGSWVVVRDANLLSEGA